jgi:hypothetical protein
MAMLAKKIKKALPSSRFVFHDLDVYELFRKTRDHAFERGITFDMTRADVGALLLRSGGRCEVSGIPFNKHYKPDGCTKRPWFPSIDRIDSRGPYSTGNCRLVCVAVNIALGEWGIEVLRELARTLVLGNR